MPSSRWITARSSAAPPARGTIGGALAANLSGPRRIKAGAARDHFLGFTAVSGRGETFKSGGRVVKNVTGYDLCKLLAGSWGTLAAMTDVTIKMLPRAETEETVLVLGLDDARPPQAHGGGRWARPATSRARRICRPRSPRALPSRIAGSAASPRSGSKASRRRSRIARTRWRALLAPFGALATLDEAASRDVLARGPRRHAVRGEPHAAADAAAAGASRRRRRAAPKSAARCRGSRRRDDATTGPAA